MSLSSFSRFFASLWRSDPYGADRSSVSGLLVNLDGTPMLNDAIDVTGKPYGDSGSSLSDDHGGFDSGMDSSSSSDW